MLVAQDVMDSFLRKICAPAKVDPTDENAGEMLSHEHRRANYYANEGFDYGGMKTKGNYNLRVQRVLKVYYESN
jgi:hypothetical protein